MFLSMTAANQALMRYYVRIEGRAPNHPWRVTRERFESFCRERRLNSLFLGDSVVVEIKTDMIDENGFNLARGGFDPSRLAGLNRYLSSLPYRAGFEFLSLTPAHLSENDWTNPLDLPKRLVAQDSFRDFYADSNSLRPLLWGGGNYLMSLIETRWEGVKAGIMGLFTGAAAPPRDVVRLQPGAKYEFRIREPNYKMIEDFKAARTAAGVRVVWLYLPCSSEYAAVLWSSPKAAAFSRYSARRIREIFGPDIIDMRGLLADSEMDDIVHPNAVGSEKLSGELARRIRRKYAGFD
jgi:hypothetical protein